MRHFILSAATVALISCAVHPQSEHGAAASSSSTSLVGSWELVSRLDRTADGRTLDDPIMGSDPIGLLIYDSGGHVSAQVMRRSGRSPAAAPPLPQADAAAESSRSAAVGGYFAYFGTYVVDTATHTVTHHVIGALYPTDVGRELIRRFRFEGDQLVLDQKTRAANGEQVTRSLRWRRVE